MKKQFILFIKLILCVTIVIFIAKNIDFAILAKLIKTTDLKLLTIGIAILFFNFLLVTLRWMLILRSQGIDPKFKNLLKINMIGLFFNNFFLGANGGDFMKMVFVNKIFKNNKISAVTSVFIDRLSGFASFLILGTIMILLNYEVPVFRKIFKIILPCYAIIFLFLILFANKQKISRIFLLKQLIKSNRIRDILNKIYDSIHIFRQKKKDLIGIMVIGFFAQFLLIVSIFFIGLSLSIDGLKFINYLTVVPIIQLVSAIPLSFSGLGITEGAYIYFLKIFSISSEKALALSFLCRITTIFWSLMGGVVFYFNKTKK